jgi:arginyl-tRNA synthetase
LIYSFRISILFIIGDEEALNLWQNFREMSIDNLNQVYKVKFCFVFLIDFTLYNIQLFNIHFDEYQSESQFSNQAKEIVHQLCELGYCKQRSNGVWEATIPAQYNSLPRDACFIIQKSDGTTLYITRLVKETLLNYSNNIL